MGSRGWALDWCTFRPPNAPISPKIKKNGIPQLSLQIAAYGAKRCIDWRCEVISELTIVAACSNRQLNPNSLSHCVQTAVANAPKYFVDYCASTQAKIL